MTDSVREYARGRVSGSEADGPARSPAHAHTRSRAHFFSNVAAVAYKEASVLRHDPAFIAAVLVQPIMMLLLFGLALSNKPANVPWALLDQSHTAASRRFVDAVQSTGYFLPPRSVRQLRRRADPAQARRGGRVRRRAERLPPRHGARAVRACRCCSTGPTRSARRASAATSAWSAPRSRPTPQRWRAAPRCRPVDLRQHFFFNPTLRDREFFLAALAGMLLTNLCLSATSLGIVGERESGTFEHMLSSPTTPIEIVLGKLVPLVAISYAVLLFAVGLSGLCFGIWPHGSWLALLVVTLPFVLASLSIGVLVSTLAATSAQAVFISVFFILPSFVLSGSMIPYQLMPPSVRWIGALLPLRWYQIA